ISFVAIAASGRDALTGFADLFSGAFGGPGPLGETAIKSAILVLTGLSVAVAFTVGLFNIGAEGQLIWGALAAAVIGQLDVPGAMALGLLGAAVAGAGWGFIAGWLKVRRGVHEVISTILLNWVAIHLVHGWLVAGPLAAAGSGATVSIAGTDPSALPPGCRGCSPAAGSTSGFPSRWPLRPQSGSSSRRRCAASNGG